MSNWSPQEYISEAKSLQCGERFIHELEIVCRDQHRRGLPIVFGLKHLSLLSNSNYKILYSRMQSSEGLYRVFNIRKRSNGYRQITVPCPSLKIAQEWINSNILKTQTPHYAATAYSKGDTPFENARRHCPAKWLIKLDVTNFFESISEKQVFHVFNDIGYSPLISFQLARICTRTSEKSAKYQKGKNRWVKNGIKIGHLPQGAPTSPKLSNLVCSRLDERLQEIGDKYRCNYTRYADDITFSGDELDRSKASAIISASHKTLGKFGFQRNRSKTHVSPPGSRKIVTGLLVDSDRPRLTKSYKERITKHLYFVDRFGPHGHCERIGFDSIPSFIDHLHGLITYAEHIDNEFGSSCRKKFDCLDWEGIMDFSIYAKSHTGKNT